MYFTNALKEVIQKYFNIEEPQITSVDYSFSPRSWRILVVHIEKEDSLVMSFDPIDRRCIIDRYINPHDFYNIKTTTMEYDISINYVCSSLLYTEHMNRVEEFGFPFETFKRVNSVIKQEIDELWR